MAHAPIRKENHTFILHVAKNGWDTASMAMPAGEGSHSACCTSRVSEHGAGSEAASGADAAAAHGGGRAVRRRWPPAGGRVDLWPMPSSVTRGAQTLHVSRDLKLTTAGSNYSDGRGILRDAFARMVAVVKMDHVINGSYQGAPVLAGVNVVVRSPDDKVCGRLDGAAEQTSPLACFFLETCFLIDSAFLADWKLGCQFVCTNRGLVKLLCWIHAQTVYGALHALENILHWHIVDEQSFPLEIPSYPKLWNGAYSYSERYTMDEAIDIVQYAEKRGVNVLAEIDVPGHARSWGVGYPSLWPSATCKEPLDVSSDFTFKVIDGILSDFSKVFKFKFVHLGGDEVNTSCWTTTPRIESWYANSTRYE
ncbi:hypothetical protein PR202_gb01248 [Eleusine coracana subsp. coracana]|uniref:beta-N-acetylhexosaminidase n=1 Tax=Eleusine coracana subsp. coracana TaxID=191504 RepID=A0AAV5DWZ1_ELECO|nr:hypothetical protein PR202_gb01248 [Eleusine coracana subsp. coracana]